MHDARDAEDRRLLAAGDHKLLVAGYFHLVRERCLLKLRNRDAADEAAQAVFVRLLAELSRGKTYPVPFRVVVWKVVEWTVRGTYPGAKPDAELPEEWEGADEDAYGDWETEHDIAQMRASLPPRQREVAELRWLRGLEPAEIAAELGIEPNAVYQALHNANEKLKRMLLVT
jgi:RNA polymerase sigma factor (sigma-70 family)